MKRKISKYTTMLTLLTVCFRRVRTNDGGGTRGT